MNEEPATPTNPEGDEPAAPLNGEGEATDAEQTDGVAQEPQTTDAPQPDEGDGA